MTHIVDSRLYGGGYATPEMRRIFSDRLRCQRWLDVEAALALTQGELGVIPAEAAEEIAARANVENVIFEQVEEGIRRTNHSLVPLLKQIQNACRDSLGEYIHYGVTTQDIEDTGAVLEMRDACGVVVRDVRRAAGLLADLAEEHIDTVMAGRTHGQQALVTTFGYRVAVWLDEVLRHLERLEQLGPRVFRVSLFGGVGTMSALPQGRATLAAVARRLGLVAPDASWHTARDGVAEFVTVMAMIAATFGKIANEIYVLAKTEFGELAEPHTPGKVGSSTMPHKRNPEFSEQVAMLARLAKYQSAVALESMMVEHDRDGRAWRMDWVSVPEVCFFLSAALSLSLNLLEGLDVRTDRMAANLRLQKDFLFSEALMIHLGGTFGKQTAHELVYEAAMEAHDLNESIVDRLLNNPQVAERLDRAELESVTDPLRHLGEAQALTRQVVNRSRSLLDGGAENNSVDGVPTPT